MGGGRTELKYMAVDFYTNLFRSDKCSPPTFISGHFPSIEWQQQGIWDAEFRVEETKKALMEMGSWKAPGPDGYQPGFFKATWAITGASTHQFVKEILEGKEVSEEAAS